MFESDIILREIQNHCEASEHTEEIYTSFWPSSELFSECKLALSTVQLTLLDERILRYR